MSRSIAHRGPDDDGSFLDAGVGLAARRLSIIDVEGGHQPITNEDRTIWIVFNGEIYNHERLRLLLSKLGHRFQTRADTEAVVHAYEEFGPDCVRYLNGMFAFALWDSKARKLFLARDRFGIKPLYYTLVGEELVFGSELKAILEHPQGGAAHRCRRPERVSLVRVRPDAADDLSGNPEASSRAHSHLLGEGDRDLELLGLEPQEERKPPAGELARLPGAAPSRARAGGPEGDGERCSHRRPPERRPRFDDDPGDDDQEVDTAGEELLHRLRGEIVRRVRLRQARGFDAGIRAPRAHRHLEHDGRARSALDGRPRRALRRLLHRSDVLPFAVRARAGQGRPRRRRRRRDVRRVSDAPGPSTHRVLRTVGSVLRSREPGAEDHRPPSGLEGQHQLRFQGPALHLRPRSSRGEPTPPLARGIRAPGEAVPVRSRARPGRRRHLRSRLRAPEAVRRAGDDEPALVPGPEALSRGRHPRQGGSGEHGELARSPGSVSERTASRSTSPRSPTS